MLFSLSLLLCGAQPVPVEGQPLAANVARVAQAFDALGTPLPPTMLKEIAAADRDGDKLQRLLDPRVLLIVSVNPEGRVKVARGTAAAELQQHGYTPALVKVVNDSAVRHPLTLSSPQGGPVYGDKGKPDRFFNVELYTAPPMTAPLSGLKVEYAVALLFSTEAGRREATIAADVGQGTQELGFRGEAPVLFDVRPAVTVTLGVRDETGAPSVGRFTFTDARGRVYPPQAKRLAPDFFFQTQIYRPDAGTVLLPPGELTMTYSRGPEYRQQTRKVTIPAKGPHRLDVKLERWIDPAAVGFYSGDHHIHAAGCAHYTSPTEGVFAKDMFLHVKGEGLNVGCNLTWGPCFEFQRQFFEPMVNGLSEPLCLLKYDLEISGFGSQALGHVCLLNLTDQNYPGSDGTKTKGWPTWTTPVMRWAKKQGGVTGYAHSANGLGVSPAKATRRLFVAVDTDSNGGITPAEAKAARLPLPEPFAKLDANGDGVVSEPELAEAHLRTANVLPNLCIPEMDGIGAQEICVTVAEGVCDFISAMDTNRVQEWNCWYHILNCGFPLKASGETDFPCISGSRVGQGRVYVQMGKQEKLDFGDWCRGLAAGRSYISDGYAHALKFSVNGVSPGPEPAKLAAPGKLAVTAQVAFAKEMPLGTAVGGRAGGPMRTVELIVNGRVAAKQEVPADDRLHDLSFNVNVEQSSWVALRSTPQLHTNPVTVLVNDKPIRASRDSALWCVGMIEQLWRVRAKEIIPVERVEADITFRNAIAKYRQIAADSR